MQNLAFKDSGIVSMSQIIILCLFIAAVFGISLWLRRNQVKFRNFFPKQADTDVLSASVQKIDSKTNLYKLSDKHTRYLVFEGATGVILLDKKDIREGIDND